MPKGKAKHPHAEEVRLQMFLARAAVASRRHSEELIAQGRVSVNGAVVTAPGTRVRPGVDRVLVDGEPVEEQPTTWIALHKPKGYVTTRHDPYGRKTVYELLPEKFHGLFHVGRLDRDSEGVLLLTNDGELANRMLHPSHGITKEYHADVEGKPTSEEMHRLTEGVEVDGERFQAESVRRLHQVDENVFRLEVVLREGKKREVRRMLDAVGHRVRRLIRRRFGPVSLGELPAGKWRVVTPAELGSVKAEKKPKRPAAHRSTAVDAEAEGGDRPPRRAAAKSASRDRDRDRPASRPGAKPKFGERAGARSKAGDREGAKPKFGDRDGAKSGAGPRGGAKAADHAHGDDRPARAAGPKSKAGGRAGAKPDFGARPASRPGAKSRSGPRDEQRGPAGKAAPGHRPRSPERGPSRRDEEDQDRPSPRAGERGGRPAGRPGGKPGFAERDRPAGRGAKDRDRPTSRASAEWEDDDRPARAGGKRGGNPDRPGGRTERPGAADRDRPTVRGGARAGTGERDRDRPASRGGATSGSTDRPTGRGGARSDAGDRDRPASRGGTRSGSTDRPAGRGDARDRDRPTGRGGAKAATGERDRPGGRGGAKSGGAGDRDRARPAPDGDRPPPRGGAKPGPGGKSRFKPMTKRKP